MRLCGRLEPLEWESEFFGLSTAKLHVDPAAKVLTERAFSAYARVQAKVNADNTQLLDTLQNQGFRLVEGEIDLCIPIERASEASGSGQIATGEDIALIRAAAGEAFRLSRFRVPWYKPQDSERFYALWAEKAVLGTFDHLALWVKDTSGEVQGFVTLRKTASSEARIGLLATLPAWQGHGIGKQLMAAAKQWCTANAVSRLYVATQTGNLAALNLYLASGGKISHSAYWLYR
ncbi:TDP-fucosamine acetyltransferase [Enterobacterales bacterium]|nr:TDP-fucosamine acetyltransferase [Enterobacterales bacterium]